MKNTTRRLNLSALALAGLALGMASTSHAGTSDAKTEAKGCKGKASCKGVTVDSAAQKEDHTCSGNGYCGGVDQVKGAVKDSSAKAAKKAAVLAAKSEKEFKMACEAAGAKTEKTSCKGQNSCKGVYFVGKAAAEVSCKGQSSCHGLVCAL